MASAKAECDNLTADTENTSTVTYTQFEKLSADTERTLTETDTQFENHHAEGAYNMDPLDTLSLARMDRENQGSWEAEYSYGGEADLHQHCAGCKKNPGHKNFIPVDKFTEEDLPEGYRDLNLVDYIRAVSDLTVRVAVKYVSDRRPATIPWKVGQYPMYSDRGKYRTTFGSGWVIKVDVFDRRAGALLTCTCKDCNNSSTAEKIFAQIIIRTATHVVFDEREAEHTTFHLFFDRGSTPETCQGVVTLTGELFEKNDINRDTCEVKCFTHDVDWSWRLKTKLENMMRLDNCVKIKFNSHWKFKRTLNVADKQPLLFIVSHPHGCSKQISLGRVICAHKYNSIIKSFDYSTPSCPGSSGAPAFMPHMALGATLDNPPFEIKESHCGVSEDQTGMNCCRSIQDFALTVNLLKFNKAAWTDYFSPINEKERRKHYDTCEKNPGHQNFYPVDKFRKDNLLPVYRTDDVFDLIKIVSDLTVRVSVNYVCERPKSVPGTDFPCPWYSHRKSSQLREGNGWIDNVEFNANNTRSTCDCKECQSSQSPKTKFAYIRITSATHLVYNEEEAKHTTCQLVMDSHVTFNDIYRSHYSIDDDTCQLIYVSHDMGLACRINNLIENFTRLYRLEEFEEVTKIKMYIAVSHPHGCDKQISILYCSNNDNTETENKQIPYASIICPGSSGARLVTLGWDTIDLEIM